MKQKNKLTNKDIKDAERIMDKCTNIQLVLYLGQIEKRLYERLNKIQR